MTEIALRGPQAVALAPAWTEDEATLLKQTLCPGVTDAHMRLFAHVAKTKGLSPFANQISMQIRKTKDGPRPVFITHIDAYRVKAARTGEYAGNDEPIFEMEGRSPIVARVTVYRLVGGMRCPFIGVARWDEFVQKTYEGKLAGQWGNMPFVMLGKCAEAQALRKAFPEELGDLYLREELSGRPDDDEIQPMPVAAPATLAAELKVQAAAPPKDALAEKVERMFMAFAGHGVTAADVLKHVGRARNADITVDDMHKLAKWFDELEQGPADDAVDGEVE